MKRGALFKTVAAFGVVTAIPFVAADELSAWPVSAGGQDDSEGKKSAATNPLTPPASGHIPVAFVLSKETVVIDFAGPWEVFQKAKVSGRSRPFRPYTVAENNKAMDVQFGGMKIVPKYTFDNAPAPKVIVIPAQDGSKHAMLDWIRKSSQNADVTMSVCVGSYIPAKTGLLSGKPATTFHQAYDDFASSFRGIQVKRGARFADAGNVASSGGLSSGIDLALHVVERYFGRDATRETAFYLEYTRVKAG